ncbi:MAG: hypothetical protein LQ338_001953 [Usnochroma carphineum]|nr:MAG: hypothetical protein LQ338_001953 [Usnochroma carphineum]
MDSSPLTQQDRPSSFQPKIDSLYEQLLGRDENDLVDFPDGFWQEFFLLRPDKTSLRRRLNRLDADDLLRIQGETQQLFRRAVAQIKSKNVASAEAALDTLAVFLDVVLAKRYTNPSSEIITVLAGLDEVDDVFLEFADAFETVIRTGKPGVPEDTFSRRDPALTVVWCLSDELGFLLYPSGFICMFDADVETPIRILEPFLLLGLLANYNKFEFRNPYRSRLEDFVDDTAIQKVIRGFGAVCSRSRDGYVAVQEDIEAGWTLGSTLKYIGLGVLAPSRSSTPTRSPASNAEEVKDLFASLPDPDASILLSAYDFTNANKLFCLNLITQPGETPKSEPPFSAFLSLTSYILHHAYRSPRSTLYGLLNLTTLRILIEDQSLCTKLFDPTLSIPVRLSRQRQPFLPSTSHPRPAAAAILDIAVDTINHNLRRRLDIPLYIACLNILHRLLSYLVTTRSRFPYHWPLLWQTLLSLLRFLTTYAESLTHDPDLPALIDTFLATLSLVVCAGDAFLPDTAAWDDLFYKLVGSAHLLPKFRSAFASLSRPESSAPATLNPGASNSPVALVDNLVMVAGHFEGLLEEEKGKGRVGKNLGMKDVGRVIRRGVETLAVPGTEGLERWVRWREVEERGMVKRVGRAGVEDARRVVGGW